jgi:hypothetical protein
MSYYDSASLVFIPSGYKTSKAYSVKPTSGDGDLAFTRSNDTATRVGPDGLIEKVRTNYLRYSQDFSQWTTFGGATRTTGVTDPNGGTTAATISNLSSGNSTIGLVLNSNPMTIGSEPIVGSIWLKGTGTMAIYLERSVSGTYFFYSQEITLSSTWTRYQVTGATAGSRGGFSFGISNFVGSTATSVDIAFGQTEFGDIATDYIATTTAAVSVGPVANVPRLDYLNSTCGKLLLEPQRTNLALYSEQLNNAEYTGDNASFTANATASPDGYTNADLLTENSSAASHGFSAPIVARGTLGANLTTSIFAKSNGRRYINISGGFDSGNYYNAVYDLQTGVVSTTGNAGTSPLPTASIVSYGNGWYRCILTGLSTFNNRISFVYLTDSATGNGVSGKSYTGNGTSGAYFYGYQIEESAYATSYIPTLGAAVTRGADNVSKTSASSIIGQTEGTMFWEFERGAAGFDYFQLNGGSASNWILLGIDGSNFLAFINNGGVNQVNILTSLSSGIHKAAFAYKNNDCVLYLDGVQIGTDTSASIPATSVIRLGGPDTSSAREIPAYTSQAILFQTRLSNSDLAALTA